MAVRMHFDIAAFLWLLAGVMGCVVRLALYSKFRGDLAVTNTTSLNGARQHIVRRSLETTIMHLGINAGVVVLAIAAMLRPQPPPSTMPSLFGVVVTGFLVLLPICLTVDGIREYLHQRAMLLYGARVLERSHQSRTRAKR